jgi:hypothetical protein
VTWREITALSADVYRQGYIQRTCFNVLQTIYYTELLKGDHERRKPGEEIIEEQHSGIQRQLEEIKRCEDELKRWQTGRPA